MDWKKNDIFQVKIEDMSDTGEGIGKTDGFTWFIKDAVIGDVVEAKVMKTCLLYTSGHLLRIGRGTILDWCLHDYGYDLMKQAESDLRLTLSLFAK